MSLWTPHGEHPIDDDRGDGSPASGRPPVEAEDLSDDEREQIEAMAAEMAEVKRRLAAVPAAQVVANHAIGLFELAAIHLQSSPPNFGQASLAIDALAAIVDGLGTRLEGHELALRDALSQIRLAFVQLKSAHGGGEESPPPSEAPPTMENPPA
jgi:hypothetical protein